MKFYLLIFTLTILIPKIAFNQDSLKSEMAEKITFETLLNTNEMVFVAPKDYIEVETIKNTQMNYEKAYKHPTEKFEVRYAIRNHNYDWHKQIFEMTALNISGGNLPEYTNFDTGAVKSEFNADAGCTVMVQVIEDFGQEYKYCLLVYIHKKGVGDGYVFYMAEDNNIIPDLMDPIFTALTFAEKK